MYTLIDPSGHPYITATDRKALNAMLATHCVRANTARKQYAIRIAQPSELQDVKNALRAKAEGAIPAVPSERARCAGMLDKIRDDENGGKTCLCLLSWDRGDLNPKNTTKQLFFN